MLPLRGEGLIPGQETKIPYAVQCGQKNKTKTKTNLKCLPMSLGKGKGSGVSRAVRKRNLAWTNDDTVVLTSAFYMEVPIHALPPSRKTNRKIVLVEGERRLLASPGVNLANPTSPNSKGKGGIISTEICTLNLSLTSAPWPWLSSLTFLGISSIAQWFPE